MCDSAADSGRGSTELANGALDGGVGVARTLASCRSVAQFESFNLSIGVRVGEIGAEYRVWCVQRVPDGEERILLIAARSPARSVCRHATLQTRCSEAGRGGERDVGTPNTLANTLVGRTRIFAHARVRSLVFLSAWSIFFWIFFIGWIASVEGRAAQRRGARLFVRALAVFLVAMMGAHEWRARGRASGPSWPTLTPAVLGKWPAKEIRSRSTSKFYSSSSRRIGGFPAVERTGHGGRSSSRANNRRFLPAPKAQVHT